MGCYGILLKLPGISQKSKAFIKADGAAMRDREVENIWGHMKIYSWKTFGKNIAVNQKHKIDIYIYINIIFIYINNKTSCLPFDFCFGGFWFCFRKENNFL